jgi:choline kinase
VRGVVLAAGGGTRLLPLTERRPKTMLEVCGGRSILELAVRNLAAAGIADVTVVTGHAHEVIADAAPDLAERHGVEVSLRFNDRFDRMNNAYSLWLVRDVLADSALVVNGDTVHPPSVEVDLLDDRGGGLLTLALDTHKPLAEEEMKVLLDSDGGLERISKQLEPATAAGEYIGVTKIGPDRSGELASALRATWERDPDAYYEDGFQEYVDRGGRVTGVPIGRVDWVEVDDHADLERARSLPCTCP